MAVTSTDGGGKTRQCDHLITWSPFLCFILEAIQAKKKENLKSILLIKEDMWHEIIPGSKNDMIITFPRKDLLAGSSTSTPFSELCSSDVWFKRAKLGLWATGGGGGLFPIMASLLMLLLELRVESVRVWPRPYLRKRLFVTYVWIHKCYYFLKNVNRYVEV